MAEAKMSSIKGQLREQLETARSDYYSQLETVTDDQWSLPSANPKSTVGGEFVHIAGGLGTIPLRMESARTGKAKSRMPRFVFDFVNTRLTNRMARQYNRQSVRSYFDEQFKNVIQLLDGVEDREWNLISYTYIQRWTVQELFAYQVVHIREHLGNAKVGLGR